MEGASSCHPVRSNAEHDGTGAGTDDSLVLGAVGADDSGKKTSGFVVATSAAFGFATERGAYR
ncbi:hypothetical protein C9J85_05125 [Haloferax sp. wsp5]|nr:hypothetical protein C9J85_05125 [Haloferax sp. wsp5]